MDKKRPGRPRKDDSDKIKYQRIAVYLTDYEKFVVEIEKRKKKNPKFQLTEAFSDMVNQYAKK